MEGRWSRYLPGCAGQRCPVLSQAGLVTPGVTLPKSRRPWGGRGGAIQAALPLCGHSSASGGQGGGASLQLHSLSCSSWRTLVFSATLNRICIFYALAVYLTKYLGVFFIPPPH